MATPTVEEVLSDEDSDAPASVATAAGTAVGDVLVAVGVSDFYELASFGPPTPGTWSLVESVGPDDAVHMRAWTRVVDSSGSQTVSLDPINDEDVGLYVYRLSGADGTTPVDDSASTNGTTASTSHVAPGVAPTSADALLACFWATGNGAYTATPGGMTGRAPIDGDPFYEAIAADEALASSGATGTRTATFDASRPWVAISLAVQGATAGGEITPEPVTITAGTGTLTVTTGAVDVTPDPVTVTASAGTLGMAVEIAPDPAAVTATPGTLALAVDLPLAGHEVTGTPGTLSVTQSLAISLTAAAVGAAPAELAVSTGATPVVPGAVTVTASAGSLRMAVDVTPGPATVTAAAAAVALARDIPLAALAVTTAPGSTTVGHGLIVVPDAAAVAAAGTVVVSVGTGVLAPVVSATRTSTTAVSARRTSDATATATAESDATVEG